MTRSDLSSGESAIYDRQIRLWGSNAQERIKSGTILVIGVTRVTSEIAKNLVLAGTNLIFEDDRPINGDNSNFLIALEVPNTEGLSVGEATAIAARRLNEHPSVSYMHASNARSESTLMKVSATVVSAGYLDYNYKEIAQLSASCRAHGIAFFLVFDSSAISWAFSDFGQTHVVDSYTPPLKRDENTGERKAENKIEEFSFASFSQYASMPVEDNIVINKPSFPNAQAMFVKLYLEWAQDPSHEVPEPKRARVSSESPKKSSVSSFPDFVRSTLASLSLTGRGEKYLLSSRETLVESILAVFAEFEKKLESLPHIAAILAALVTQEVIKYVTKRDPPLVNQIMINPTDCGAIVVKTPKSLSSRVISNVEPEQAMEGDEVQILNGNSVDVSD